MFSVAEVFAGRFFIGDPANKPGDGVLHAFNARSRYSLSAGEVGGVELVPRRSETRSVAASLVAIDRGCFLFFDTCLLLSLGPGRFTCCICQWKVGADFLACVRGLHEVTCCSILKREMQKTLQLDCLQQDGLLAAWSEPHKSRQCKSVNPDFLEDQEKKLATYTYMYR